MFFSDAENSFCGLVKPILLIVFAAFLLSLRMCNPEAQSEKIESTQSINVVSYYIREAYNWAVTGFNKAIETLKCIRCGLFGVNCKSSVEDTPINESGSKKGVIDIQVKPKNDRFAMFKPNLSKKNKKEEPSKSESCHKCTEKGEVCPKACLMRKKK